MPCSAPHPFLRAKLAPLLARAQPEGLGTEALAQYMIELHDLVAVSDSAVPDHIRHSGNVVFTGYYLLNRVDAFQALEQLPNYSAQAFGGAARASRFEILNLAWILASLFRDSGYALEHSKSVLAVRTR